MPSIRDNGDGGDFEAGPGCGPVGIAALIALLIVLAVLANKGFITL